MTFKNILYVLILMLEVVTMKSQNPSLDWVNGAGGSSSDQGFSIVTDQTGNVYSTGRFSGTIDVDPGTNSVTLVSAGFEDVYFTKFDASGNLLWAKSFGGNSDDVAFQLTLDLQGNIYICGIFRGTCDFDPGPGTLNLTSTIDVISYDAFVAKFNSSGDLIWAKQIGSAGYDFANGLCVNQGGEIYVTGSFVQTVDLDPGSGTLTATTNGLDDIFIVKLNSSGSLLWAHTMGSTGTDGGSSVVFDASGSMYLSGYFSSTVDLDPGPGTSSFTSAGSLDAFLLKLNASGNFIWAKTYGGPGIDNCIKLEKDPSGNLYSTGYFQNTVDFDPGAGILNLVSAGNQDIYTLKLDASANLIWAKRAGNNGNDYGASISLDALNNVYVAGSFSGKVDFDPGTGSYSLTAKSYDGFVFKLDPSGNFVWAVKTGGKFDDRCTSVTLDNMNNVYVTGYFKDTCDFDPGAGSYNLISSDQAIFEFKLVQCNGAIPSVNAVSNRITICSGESSTLTASGANKYRWDGGSTSASVVVSPTLTTKYIVTGLDPNGCSDTAIVTQIVDVCVNIVRLQNYQEELKIYPNPTTGAINMILSSDSEVMVLNTIGQPVYSDRLSAGEHSINLEPFPSGIYSLKLVYPNSSTCYKIIRQ